MKRGVLSSWLSTTARRTPRAGAADLYRSVLRVYWRPSATDMTGQRPRVMRRTPARDTYDRLATFPIEERQERGSLAELISAIVVRFFGDRRQAMLEESSPAMLATTWRSCRFLRNSLSRRYSS